MDLQDPSSASASAQAKHDCNRELAEGELVDEGIRTFRAACALTLADIPYFSLKKGCRISLSMEFMRQPVFVFIRILYESHGAVANKSGAG